MKIKICFLATTLALFAARSDAQSVAITENGGPPDAKAILDVQAQNKGVLFPRMSSASRLALPNIKGMLVYDSAANSFWYNTGNGWQAMGLGYIGQAWGFTGNSGTTDSNFLGPIGPTSLFIKTNGEPSGHIGLNTGNTAWGLRAGNINTGSLNTALGPYTLPGIISGQENSAMGAGSLFFTDVGHHNTACGTYSLQYNDDGSQSTAFGSHALPDPQIARLNSSVGYQSLYYDFSGSNNTATGVYSMRPNNTHNNTAIGAYALYKNYSGEYHTGVGFYTGEENPSFGAQSNTRIGTYTSARNENSTAIGFMSFDAAIGGVRIGNNAVTVIEGAVPFTTASDGRFKYNVRDDVHGLDFILKLRPVTYQFDAKNFDEQQRGTQNDSITAVLKDIMKEAYEDAISIRRSGFIAQEVQDAATATGYHFSGVNTPKSDQDHYSLSYASFVVPLVKAVKEQQQIIADLQKQLAELKPLVQQRAGNKQQSHLKQP